MMFDVSLSFKTTRVSLSTVFSVLPVVIYTYSGEIQRDYTGADEVLVCKDCERLSSECNFISSLSRRFLHILANAACWNHQKWFQNLAVSVLQPSGNSMCLGQIASSGLNTGLVSLLLLLLFECFISHFRKQERPEAQRPYSKREFTCREKMRDVLRCSNKSVLKLWWNQETYCSRCST